MTFAALTALTLGNVTVVGNLDCPSASAVQRHLPANPSSEVSETGLVVMTGLTNEIHLRLFDDKGQLVNQRRLALHTSCEILARVVAATVESMELELSGPPPIIVALPPRRDIVAPPTEVTSDLQETPLVPSRALRLAVGAALLGSVSSDGWAPAGELLASLRREGNPWRLEGSFLADGDRTLALGAGSIVYQRLWLSVGAGYGFPEGRWELEPQVALLASLLTARGEHFVQNQQALELGAGGLAGLTLVSNGGVWVGLFLAVWPNGPRATVANPPATHPFSEMEGLFGLGIRNFGS